MNISRVVPATLGLLLLAAPLRAAPDAGSPDDLAFVPNRGQWPQPVVAFAEAGPVAIWAERDGLLLDLRAPRLDEQGLPTDAVRGAAVRLRFVDARETSRVRPEGRPGAERHLFLGDDPQRWASHLRSSSRLRWTSLYDGIDLRARGAADGTLEYDLFVDDGARLDDVIVQVEGALGLELRADGALVVRTALGDLVQRPPLLFARGALGTRVALPCEVVPLDATRFGFHAPAARGRSIVLDPVLEWGTFLGGAHSDLALDLRADVDGSLVVVGSTQAGSYPATTGAYDTTWNGAKDVCVSRLSSDGATLLSSTYLGGAKDEEAQALALLPDGAVAVVGWTASSNFPKTPGAYDPSFGGGTGVLQGDAFVSVLEPACDALRVSTLLGGKGDDLAFDVAVRDDGALVVAGKTSSSDFPTTGGAFDRTYGGGGVDGGDAFVAVLASDGTSLLASTFVGGASDEIGNALLLDDAGRPTLVGWTASSDFPVTVDAPQKSLQGGSDGFVVTLARDLDGLVFATLLGGASDENLLDAALDPEGRLIVVGSTRSAGLPVSEGATQSGYGGGVFFGDGLCARYVTDRHALDLLAYAGGSADDVLTAVARAADGSLVLAGWTSSSDGPLSGPSLSAAPGGASDGLLLRLAPDGDALLLGSVVGGASADKIFALDLLADGRVAVCGMTTSSGFPVTTGAYDASFGGVANLISDGFVACVDADVPTLGSGPFVDLGFGLAGSSVPLLSASGTLAGGGVLRLRDAPAHAPGALAVGLEANAIPLLGGVLVPFPFLVLAPFTSDTTGALDVPFAPSSAGEAFSLFVQAWIQDAGAAEGFCASNALEVHVP
ncbi:MAG: hypothetical protein H6825_04135 [Planctomycetes bacterium]|nr:hypothetical protein [Planctomycetota bacterium]